MNTTSGCIIAYKTIQIRLQVRCADGYNIYMSAKQTNLASNVLGTVVRVWTRWSSKIPHKHSEARVVGSASNKLFVMQPPTEGNLHTKRTYLQCRLLINTDVLQHDI